MQILKNRPLALFCCVLSATAVLALSLSVAQKRQWLIIALLLCSLFYLLARLLCRFRKLFLYGVYLFLGFGIALTSSYLFFDVYLPHTQQGEGEMHHIEGVVFERTSSTSFSSGFYVQLLSLDGEENHETVYLSCDYSSPLQLGDYFAADVYQERMESDQGFRDAASLLSEGITRVLTLEKSENCLILKEKCRELPVLVKQWNHQLSSRLYHAVEGQEGALAAALLLGNRSFLSGDTTLAFRRAGISHLLALSGMHVAVIAGFLEILLRRLRFSKLIRAIAVPPVLIGYLLLTGASPSTVRAVVMISVLYLGFLLRADYDSVTAVCVVPAAFMIISPNAVYDLSLWMSFLAAFSIIVF